MSQMCLFIFESVSQETQLPLHAEQTKGLPQCSHLAEILMALAIAAQTD